MILAKFREFFSHVFNIREGTDVKGTIDSIRSNIALRGYNVWFLVASAVIASIGLDVNSSAVIIGAMLISPLMSPILGVGLSVGINDRKTLYRSLENLATAVVVAIMASALYFWITPFGDAGPLILSRTQPTLLDVLVAFFGGVAGIVAGSRKEPTGALPGVAIATALMPPLCVTGYGLAKMRWDIFFGSFYLFFLNAVFIALSTYLVVRFLRFPYMDFIDEESRKKVSRWMTLFVIVLIVPSGILFYTVITNVQTNRKVDSFIMEYINDDYHRELEHQWVGNNNDTLQVVVTGKEYIDSLKELSLIDKFHFLVGPKYELQLLQLNDPDVNIEELANQTESRVEAKVLQVLEVKEKTIELKDNELTKYKAELDSLMKDAYGLERVKDEVRALYPDIQSLGYSLSIRTDFKQQDSIPLVIVSWDKRRVSSAVRRDRNRRIGSFFQARMKLDTIEVIEQ